MLRESGWSGLSMVSRLAGRSPRHCTRYATLIVIANHHKHWRGRGDIKNRHKWVAAFSTARIPLPPGGQAPAKDGIHVPTNRCATTAGRLSPCRQKGDDTFVTGVREHRFFVGMANFRELNRAWTILPNHRQFSTQFRKSSTEGISLCKCVP